MKDQKKQKNYDNIILLVGLLLSAVVIIYIFIQMDKTVLKENISEVFSVLDYAVDLFIQSIPFNDIIPK